MFGGKPPKVVKVSTYWDHNGKFQTLQDQLFQQLVPASGKCNTVEGELLRAASKIYYDYYNNGFGNNWSGAWNFLDSFTGNIPIASELEVLYPYRCGKTGEGPELDSALESLVDKVILYISEKNGNYTENTADMYDLSEKDNFESDEEDDWRSGWEDPDETSGEDGFESSRTSKLKAFAKMIRNSNESPLRAVRQMLTEAASRVENLRSSKEVIFQPGELDALIKVEALIEKGRQILFEAQTDPPKKPATPKPNEATPAVKTPDPEPKAPTSPQTV
jgi:hypothetical protein